jgi:hypothetical protein
VSLLSPLSVAPCKQGQAAAGDGERDDELEPRVVLQPAWPANRGVSPLRGGPETHRVDPESGSTLKALIVISSQTAGSTCEFWVSPVNFTFGPRRYRRPRSVLAFGSYFHRNA